MTPWKRWTIRTLVLVISFSLQPYQSLLAEEKSDGATEALQSINGILNAGGQAIGAIGVNQQQMQAMMNQFAMMQAKNANLGQQTGAIQQIQQQLGQKLAEAQMCMQNAVKDVKKYKKNKYAPSQLETFEPITCENYGNLMDSIRANLDKIDEVNTKLQCMRTLQNNVNQIASAAQGPFQQLTQTATDIWNVREQIIGSHKEIADQIEAEVDGENGYRARLNSLKKLSLELQQVVYGRAEFKAENGMPGGYAQKLATLKRERQKMAKQWYQSISNKTQACFSSNPFMECDVGQPMAPLDCVMNYIAGASGKTVGGEKRAKNNKDDLMKSFRLAQGDIFDKSNTLVNMDINNPNAFLTESDKGFESMLTSTLNKIGRQPFAGAKVDNGTIINFARKKYRECYQKAREEFIADLSSEGGEYKGMYNAVKDSEAQYTSELKNWVDIVSNQMSEFKQSFSKVYNNDLEKFSSECTAGDSPYQAYDCLATLRANLKSGIEGAAQFYKLADGTQQKADVGNTTLNVSTVSLDQNTGKPTVSQSQVQCKGFNECISFLDKSKAHHRSQETKQTKEREEFVQQHNKTIQGAMSAVGAQFGAISQMFVDAAGALTQEFDLFGVKEAVKTKQIEGEALVANEKTGLYDMPKSMKAAFAGTASYSELDTPESLAGAIGERKNVLNKKLVDAAKKKAQCDIKKADYEEIAKRLGSCSAESICKGTTLSGSIRSLERLMRKSQKNPDKDEKDRLYEEHDKCVRQARNTKGNLNEADALLLQGSTKEEKIAALESKRSETKKDQEEEIKNCSISALESIDALAGDSRGVLKTNNEDITSALKEMAGSCPADPDAAADACEKAKKAAEKAELPDNEGETPIRGSGDDDSNKSNKKENPIKDAL
ncbi:MAG: hypothetical protein M9962_10250 [Oligoflexia bacterium]|nr:hypothetical protein [Oligoflexia bacterium]